MDPGLPKGLRQTQWWEQEAVILTNFFHTFPWLILNTVLNRKGRLNYVKDRMCEIRNQIAYFGNVVNIKSPFVSKLHVDAD